MIETSINQTSGLQSAPQPVVQMYGRNKQVTTVNVGIKKEEKADGENNITGGDGDGFVYSCTTLSLVSASPVTIGEVLRTLCANNLYGALQTDELAAIAERFGVTIYEALAAALISGRYTYADELACHRKALLGDAEDLAQLASFADECKAMARGVFGKE